jgi:hypothetical protein
MEVLEMRLDVEFSGIFALTQLSQLCEILNQQLLLPLLLPLNCK